MTTAHGLPLHIAPVDVERIFDLRYRVLRAGLPLETARFPGDEDPHTTHFAVYMRDEDAQPCGNPICCASFMLTEDKGITAWQLRGMATEPAYQGRGVGAELLQTAEQELPSNPRYAHIRWMWCNAREPAVKFYEKNGWHRASIVFDIPTAGPHIRMLKFIQVAS